MTSLLDYARMGITDPSEIALIERTTESQREQIARQQMLGPVPFPKLIPDAELVRLGLPPVSSGAYDQPPTYQGPEVGGTGIEWVTGGTFVSNEINKHKAMWESGNFTRVEIGESLDRVLRGNGFPVPPDWGVRVFGTATVKETIRQTPPVEPTAAENLLRVLGSGLQVIGPLSPFVLIGEMFKYQADASQEQRQTQKEVQRIMDYADEYQRQTGYDIQTGIDIILERADGYIDPQGNVIIKPQALEMPRIDINIPSPLTGLDLSGLGGIVGVALIGLVALGVLKYG